MKWFEKFAESVHRHAGKNKGRIIANGWESVPTGSSKRAVENRSRWIKSAVDSLDRLCDEKTSNLIMVDTCPHSYPKTRIREMRAEFERLGDLDELIELMRRDTSWGEVHSMIIL